ARLRRRFEIDGTGLTVDERVLDAGSVEELRFRWPAQASERAGDGRTEARYRLA
ncbi:MAG: hypothetical protein HUU28_04630, partial [Planctomycetaceae bacterium]|nr:hypothetical protein [Planctomycetaceae bacterium]